MLGSFEIRVELHLEELRPFRHRLDGWLEEHELTDPPRAAVVLAAHEALANAIEHSASKKPVLITVESRSDGFAIEIIDDGQWKFREGPACDRGRGLDLIKALVTYVQINQGPAGDDRPPLPAPLRPFAGRAEVRQVPGQ